MSHAPTQNDPNWPPKSPHQALLSSPSGRKKWEHRRRDQPSPAMGTPRAGSRASQLLSDGIEAGDTDEDDDEETLQLKLQAIEARLKLKKLQAAKAKHADPDAEDSDTRNIFSPRPRRETVPIPKERARAVGHSRTQSDVQVPLSPTSDRRAAVDPTSPARVKLGIDKGLRAQDVSLKRPAFSRDNSNSSRFGLSARSDRPSSFSGPSGGASRNSAMEKPKSFSERLAESRLKDNEKQAKEERIQRSRSRGFGLDTVERTGSSQDQRAPSQQSNGSTNSFDRPARSDLLRRKQSSSTNSSLSSTANTSRPSSRQLNSAQTAPPASNAPAGKHSSFSGLPESTPEDGASFEPFSGLHLSKRLLSHNIVARAFDQKELYPLPRLLATVKGPDYDPPDHECDFVIMGVIASKSTPRNTKNTVKTTSTADPDDDDGPNKSKFMVLHLTDFKWEIDLFLFGTAFTTFWKLTPGTVIAILNPGIMPPRDKRTGHFSLKLGSSEDTILEIGQSRDLGFCKSVKKDGQECGSWIDKRKTEFCDFHVYLQVEKSKRGRMEVNTMAGFGKGLSGRNGAGPEETNKRYDRSLHESMYVLPKHLSGRSTADRLDHDDDAMNRGMSREELHRKRLAEREKERELAEKLGRIGGKAGSEYMKVKASATGGRPQSFAGFATAEDPRSGSRQAAAAGAYDTPFTRSLDGPEPVDAASLGLLGKRAADVSLNPVKRKRTTTASNGSRSTTTTITSSSSALHTAEPMGWGGANKRDLLMSPSKKLVGNRRIDDMLRHDRDTLQPPQSPKGVLNLPERSRSREGSPSKKKARLMIEGKGIREPGRESMGSVAVTTKGVSSDDDDLEII